jgi:(heptosyl)LPS beta-1,4-glucosyltransferase
MRSGGWQNWNNPQLARRGLHHFENKVHEICVIDAGPEKIGQLNGEIWHLNDEDYVERVSKNLQYMQLSGQSILDRGISVRWYHILLYPLYRGLKSYVLERGYREGERGLIFAIYAFASTFNWWAFAWDRQNSLDRQDLENQVESLWRKSVSKIKVPYDGK